MWKNKNRWWNEIQKFLICCIDNHRYLNQVNCQLKFLGRKKIQYWGIWIGNAWVGEQGRTSVFDSGTSKFFDKVSYVLVTFPLGLFTCCFCWINRHWFRHKGDLYEKLSRAGLLGRWLSIRWTCPTQWLMVMFLCMWFVLIVLLLPFLFVSFCWWGWYDVCLTVHVFVNI